MRLASKKLSLGSIDAETGVPLVPAEPEDMWHANNLILAGDIVKAHAVRKVTTTTATGSTNSERVHMDLIVRVTSTFFDAAASSLHVSGNIVAGNAYVATNQFHTLDLEINRQFVLWKPSGWDSVALETLKEALTDDNPNATCAVVMQEGIANICLITDFRTMIKQRVEHTIPKKRSGAKDAAGGMHSFFEKTLNTLLRAVDFSNPRTLLLASPGFVAEEFKAYIAEKGQQKVDKQLKQMAKDAVVVHSSTGYVHSLNEILKSPQVQALMRDKKFTRETQLLDDFYEKLKRDDGRAWYGVKPVTKAVEEGAVGRGGGVLLINNALFRSQDIATRKKYVALVDKVKEDGGDARVLSSDHESGQRLDALGGIAAILTYPLQDLDEDEEEAEDHEDGEDLANDVQDGAEDGAPII